MGRLFRFGYVFRCESSCLGLLCLRASFLHSATSPASSRSRFSSIWCSTYSCLGTMAVPGCVLRLTWYRSDLLCGMGTVWTLEMNDLYHRFHKALNFVVRLWPIRCDPVMNDGVFTEIVLYSLWLKRWPIFANDFSKVTILTILTINTLIKFFAEVLAVTAANGNLDRWSIMVNTYFPLGSGPRKSTFNVSQTSFGKRDGEFSLVV